MPPFLELKAITKAFPGVVALDAVDLTIKAGEVHVLLGENGAGKSTLIKCLAGIYQPDDGEIIFNGESYTPHTPLDAIRSGMRVVHQELNLLPYLSVAENLLIESLPQRRGLVRYRKMRQEAQRLLKEVGLDISPRMIVEQLGVAQMQLLEIAKALAHDSKLIILDEPTATLTPPEIERLFAIIKKLRSQGVTFIYISHRLHETFEIGNSVTVLRNGLHIATNPVSDVDLNDIVKMMVGRELSEELEPPSDLVPGPEIFQVQGLKRHAQSPEINFTLRQGEVLGVAGLVGSGRTETMRAIFGAEQPASGRISIDGQVVSINSPRDAVQNGLCLLTEDRKSQGLMLDLGIGVNITIASLDQVTRYGLMRYDKETKSSQSLIKDLQIKTPSFRQHVRNLSGGNQQKVVLAKWLFRGGRVFIFDEPTRGIDVGAKQEIYNLIWALARQGKGVILVSSDLPELLGVCHRIMVFSHEHIVGVVDRPEFDREYILSLAFQEYIAS